MQEAEGGNLDDKEGLLYFWKKKKIDCVVRHQKDRKKKKKLSPFEKEGEKTSKRKEGSSFHEKRETPPEKNVRQDGGTSSRGGKRSLPSENTKILNKGEGISFLLPRPPRQGTG